MAANTTLNSTINTFLRSQRLFFLVSGLTPGATVYPFYQGQSISQYCAPGTTLSTTPPDQEGNWQFGNIGDALVVTTSGYLAFYFYVPMSTFIDVGGTINFYTGTTSLISYSEVQALALSPAPAQIASVTVPSAVSGTANGYVSALTPLNNSSKQTFNQFGAWSTVQDNQYSNPIAQTFTVTQQMSNGEEGIYVPKIDLFFRDVPNTAAGVTVEICDTVNGVPTPNVLVYGRTRIEGVNISTTGAASAIFPAPVFLRAGQQYAIVVLPDTGASAFTLWTAQVGQTDANTAAPIAQTWGTNQLFLSSAGSFQNGLTNESLKFNLYNCNFTSNTGYGHIVNLDYEFLSLANNSGTFLAGETAFQISANAVGTVSVANNSYTVTGTNTTFTTTYNPNDYFVVLNGSNVGNAIRILSIANNTSLTLKQYPQFSNTAANYQKTVVGRVDAYNPIYNSVTLVGSTAANSSFVFTANSLLVGTTSNAHATISSVNNMQVNRFVPTFSYTSMMDTTIKTAAMVIGSDYSSQSEIPIAINDFSEIANRSAIVASKSNEILYFGGSKSLQINVAMTSTSSYISPRFDLTVPVVTVLSNRINNDSTNENLKSGNTQSRFISKTITLADGMDASELRVYLSAYRPPYTDVVVYAKMQNSTDLNKFDDCNWTQLSKISTAVNLYSDAVNTNDYKDFEYRLPFTPPANTQSGVISTYSNTTITGVNTNFTTISNGSIVVITGGAATQVNKIVSVANSTSMTVATAVPFSTTTGVIGVATTPQTAFLNPSSNNVVRYYGADGVAYDSFKVFAIKIDLLSQYNYLSPKVDNMRALAIT